VKSEIRIYPAATTRMMKMLVPQTPIEKMSPITLTILELEKHPLTILQRMMVMSEERIVRMTV
jgi:hypothetical protein